MAKGEQMYEIYVHINGSAYGAYKMALDGDVNFCTKQQAETAINCLRQEESICIETVDGTFIGIPSDRMRDVMFEARPM